MKVLVTGGSGRFGPYLVKELEQTGHDVVLFSRRAPSKELSHLPWVQGDICVYEDCLRAVRGGFDAIQHTAAQPGATDLPGERPGYEKKGIPFDTTMRTNIMGTYYLLQAGLTADIKIFVMTGSNCALGHSPRLSNTQFQFHYLPVDEEHPSDVEDSYSYSKLTGEILLASYTRAYGIRTYVLRSAGIRNEEQRKEIARTAGPAGSWDLWLWAWVGSEDLASAHRLLMERAYEIRPHGVFFCNADDTSAIEPSKELIEKFNPGLLPLVKNLKGNASFFSNKKLCQTAGWEHKTSWRKYLKT